MAKDTLLSKIIKGGEIFYDLTRWILITVIVLVLINAFWYSVFLVAGISMEPSFKDGEVVIMNKLFYRGEKNPQRGEAVIVQYPGDPENHRYVKRVIGLPDEEVNISNGKVYINGERLRERYLPAGEKTEPAGTWTLNHEQYFLMGDNRTNSNDSRVFGSVEKRFFIGKATNIIYPRWRRVELPQY